MMFSLSTYIIICGVLVHECTMHMHMWGGPSDSAPDPFEKIQYICNQTPKFKDLNLKIPILVLKIPPLLLNFHLILSFNMIDPAPAASSTAHPGPTHEKSLRWLRRWRMVAPDNTVAPSPRRISPWK